MRKKSICNLASATLVNRTLIYKTQLLERSIKSYYEVIYFFNLEKIIKDLIEMKQVSEI